MKFTQHMDEIYYKSLEVMRSDEYEYHHSAWKLGYWPIRDDFAVEPYSGRFGDGVIIHVNVWNHSTRFHRIHYYIKK